MAKSSDSSKEVLSEIMQAGLKKSPELREKQAHLVEMLKSGTKPELQDVLTDLLTGQKQTPAPDSAQSNQEGLEELQASLRQRRSPAKPPEGSKP